MYLLKVGLIMSKKLPVLYDLKKNCCGCSACKAICPQKAIRMVSDLEGFKYPTVDKEKCISCYLCLKVCPLKK